MHQPTPSQTVKEPEAARYIGLSVPWLRQRRARGGGPAFIRVGRAVRYTVKDLDAFLSAHRVASMEVSSY